MAARKKADAGKPMWHGRFEKEPAERTQAFVESLSFDRRLYKHDITGSIAHARMLEAVGLIKPAERKAIEKGLRAIAERIDRGEFEFATADEDIHMAVEAALIREIGEPGKKLHTARSRNDQVALDLRLYLRDAIDLHLAPAIRSLQSAFLALARKQGELVMPGFTHLQHAQPVVAGAVLLTYVEQLERDRLRLLDCRRRIDCCPLGAAALAGTTLPIDRNHVAGELGFGELCRNSIDAVSDRDFAAEFVFDLALIAVHLSRWAEEWVLWSAPEFGFVVVGEQYCTGSSIMPQKRNPDVLELIRGKSGLVCGQLTGLMTMLKGLPLAYNRDLQDDKRAVFDAYDSVLASLEIAADLVASTSLDGEAMARRLDEGFLEATALAEYLVAKGTPFRQSHQIVGRIVASAEKQGRKLRDLSLDELKAFSENMASDVHRILDSRHVVAAYRSAGSAGVTELQKQINHWKKVLNARN